MQVKQELARLWPRAAHDRMAELSGLLRAGGTLELSGQGRVALRLETDQAAIARKLLLLRREASIHTEVRFERRRRLAKNLRFAIRMPPQPQLGPLLIRAGILNEAGNLQAALPAWVQARPCCARAFLRGFFLGAGSVSDPNRNLHLEMICRGPEVADALGQLLFGLGLPVRVAARKGSMVLYLKEAGQISRFLALVGAHQSVLRYEDVRVYREMRGQINRQVNAETANLEKTVAAAVRQTEAIRALENGGRLEQLPAGLRELAGLRLEHAEASLKELGELCRPPLSKSGVNHRMRLLLKLAGQDD